MRARAFAFLAILLGAALAVVAQRALAETTNQLEHVRGDVAYAVPAASATTRALAGRIALSDDARAITGFHAAARVTLPDSSVVEIGDKTDVRLDAFRDAAARHTIVLNRGALRFTIRHPAGAQSNYVFKTVTTQLAVRGTLAYLVSGPNGDQIYCVDCAPGDVAARAAGETYRVESGQTLNVRRIGGRAFDAAIVANPTVNNPAIDQFLHGFSPFGRPSSEGTDPTGSDSGR
jgi:ferric-dicitrate binding protein FerR (iron transport regulator)